MLKSPIIESDKKSQIIKELFTDRVHKMTMSFYDIITKKNREKFLPAIAREFHIQYNSSHKIGMAKVTTVFPLDDSLRADFKQLISNFTDENTVELEEEIDQELIGGYQLKIGWNQIDESLRGKLNKLKLKFS
jgi:F-type H+-transporting ATPase subunit delta